MLIREGVKKEKCPFTRPFLFGAGGGGGSRRTPYSEGGVKGPFFLPPESERGVSKIEVSVGDGGGLGQKL